MHCSWPAAAKGRLVDPGIPHRMAESNLAILTGYVSLRATRSASKKVGGI
jgi:hypothetical protein